MQIARNPWIRFASEQFSLVDQVTGYPGMYMARLFTRFRKVVLRDRFLHDTEKVDIFMNFRVFSKQFKDIVGSFENVFRAS